MKRLDREEFDAMDEDLVHLMDEVLEVFCDHPKKGKAQKLTDEKFKMSYLNLYRGFNEGYDFLLDDNHDTVFEEKLADLEDLKIEMIDAEEADYQDQDLVTALLTFFTSALILWFVAGPLFFGLLVQGAESGDNTYSFLKWLENLGSLHWTINISFLAVNWGIWLSAGLFHWFTLTSFIAIFRRKLSAEQQKEKAISSILSKIENLKSEVRRKKYIKRFLKEVSSNTAEIVENES